MWLISDETARIVQRAEQSGLAPTAQQLADFQARADVAAAGGGPRNLLVAGDVAEIRVEGALVQRPSFMLWMLGIGYTTYSSIRDALASADADRSVNSIVLAIDSPGGQVEGLFDTLAAVEATRKPMRVRAANAQSAAYALAAAAGDIQATSPAATLGSIGVAIDLARPKDTEFISISNTDSPDKRPDPSTADGRRVLVRQLDALNELFVDAIARGRKTSSANVSKNYGRGATLLAGEALKRGMIDSVAGKPAQTHRQSAAGASGTAKGKVMTPDEIRAQFPGAAAQLVNDGVALERDRVTSFVLAGERSGAMEIALKAIRDGSPMNSTMQMEFMTQAINKRDRQLRQMDSDATGEIADGAARAGKTASQTGEDEEPIAGQWLMVEKGKIRVHSAA